MAHLLWGRMQDASLRGGRICEGIGRRIRRTMASWTCSCQQCKWSRECGWAARCVFRIGIAGVSQSRVEVGSDGRCGHVGDGSEGSMRVNPSPPLNSGCDHDFHSPTAHTFPQHYDSCLSSRKAEDTTPHWLHASLLLLSRRARPLQSLTDNNRQRKTEDTSASSSRNQHQLHPAHLPSPAGLPTACSPTTAILKRCDSSTTARTLCTTPTPTLTPTPAPTNPSVFSRVRVRVRVRVAPACCAVRDFLPLAVACRHCHFTLHARPCACPLPPTRLPPQLTAPYVSCVSCPVQLHAANCAPVSLPSRRTKVAYTAAKPSHRSSVTWLPANYCASRQRTASHHVVDAREPAGVHAVQAEYKGRGHGRARPVA